MLRLIKFLFTGDWHLHEWEIIKTATWTEWQEIYVKHYVRCKHCGKIKTFKG